MKKAPESITFGGAALAIAGAVVTLVIASVLFLLWLLLYPFGLSRLIARLQVLIARKSNRKRRKK